jgi:MFS transporter, PAT family, beta-lactamase induction signal transducer AmpG
VSTAELSSTERAALSHERGPWWWVPSLYFAQALPYVLVMTVSTYAYKRLGISVVLIGYTAWLGLPWTFKPLWSPLVELIGTERRWIWITEYIASAGFAVVALGYTTEHFFLWTAVGYGLLALAAATHDIAADGFYMRVLEPHDQTWFSGIRSVAFRGGWIFGEGLLVMLVGRLIKLQFDPAAAWSVTHFVAAATFFILATYHAWALPIAPAKLPTDIDSAGKVLREVVRIFRLFFTYIPLATALPFLLLYRFAEAQVVKLLGVFLLDSREAGGLGLNEEQIGTINGTLGVAALLCGGVLAGMLAARDGVRKWLLPMAAMMNLTNVAFLALAYFQPTSLVFISLAVVIEKFGYGLGFTGFMLYMLYLAQGKHQTSFYAICTGFMTLGLIVPGSFAGYPLEWFGYTGFFIWILVCTIPSFMVTWIVYRQMDPQFGKRLEPV